MDDDSVRKVEGCVKELNWSEFDRGVFLVNLLAIIYDSKTHRILIGRREKDPFMEGLSWCFPVGRPAYHNELEDYLKSEVKKKTNLDVRVIKVVFTKTYPEDRRFLSIYYLTEPKNIGKEKAGEKFVEIKWVKPVDVKKYFTTSLHPELLKFLGKLQQSKKLSSHYSLF